MKDDICNILRVRIVNLFYKPGDPLNEGKLSQELKVSRTPVREALLRLSGEGLVTITPNIGARASDINLHEFQELIELREILERGVARLATLKVTDTQIHKLEQLADRIHHVNTDHISKLINFDMQFHQIIKEASHNRLLSESLSITQNQFFRIQRLISHKPERMSADLLKVIQALKKNTASGSPLGMTKPQGSLVNSSPFRGLYTLSE